MIFTLEWYFSQFLIILSKRMGLKDSEALSPRELYEYIKSYNEIYSLLEKFFTEYKEWYNYHKSIESKEIELDSAHLTNLSTTFQQTRKVLLQKADEIRGT